MSHAYTFAATKDTGNIALQMTLYVIAMHVNVETGKTFASIKTLMAEARVKSDRTMRNYLSELEAAGFIKREKRTRKDGGNSTDNIELCGFLEWFRATFPDRFEKAAARFTGGSGGGSKRQDLPAPPVANATGAPGRQATGHEHYSNRKINKEAASPFEKKKQPSGSPRDTEEPFPVYRARMIREGKLRADA